MPQLTAISNPQVVVNNTSIAIVPNSFSYTEGFGAQEVFTESAGGGSIQTVYANDVSTNYSMIKFTMRNYQANIDLVRSWKANQDSNTIEVTAVDFSRSFTFAALTSDYEVKLGSDTTIDLEFKSRPTF
jgi:hypothetical protein